MKLLLCKTISLCLATFIFLSFEMIMKLVVTKVFLSFTLKNLILIIKHNGKVKSPFQYNYLHSIDLVVQNLKLVFPEKKIWRNALALKSKEVQGIFEEMFILTLSSSAVFLPQNCVSNFF